jgi:hypothetical protein
MLCSFSRPLACIAIRIIFLEKSNKITQKIRISMRREKKSEKKIASGR